jgi:ribonuclease HI
MSIIIYTDGACSGNPGTGGWGGVIIKPNNNPVHLSGGKDLTTNNQMELTAAIKVLQYFQKSEKIKIYTDSKYLMNGIEIWINNWKKNGWKTASKKPVKNKELWEKLDSLIVKHIIEWQWVKGHAGNEFNEIADYLARKYIENKE